MVHEASGVAHEESGVVHEESGWSMSTEKGRQQRAPILDLETAQAENPVDEAVEVVCSPIQLREQDWRGDLERPVMGWSCACQYRDRRQ